MIDERDHIDPIDSFYKKKLQFAETTPKPELEDAIFSKLDSKNSTKAIGRKYYYIAAVAVTLLALLVYSLSPSSDVQNDLHEPAAEQEIAPVEKHESSEATEKKVPEEKNTTEVEPKNINTTESTPPTKTVPTISNKKNSIDSTTTDDSPVVDTPLETTNEEPKTPVEEATDTPPPAGIPHSNEPEKKKSFFEQIKKEKKDSSNQLFLEK